MSKTFITKFPSLVDNDNLPIYGRIVIKCVAGQNSTDKTNRYVNLQFIKPTTLKKISGANFSYQGGYPYESEKSNGLVDSAELKANIPYKIVFDSSDVDTYLAIDGKYYIKSIFTGYDWHGLNIRFNLDDSKYCGNLKTISVPCTEKVFEGNLKNVNEGLTSLAIRYNKDLNDVSHLTALTSLDMRYSSLSKGDVSALSTLVNLTKLDISGTNISGDVTNIVNNMTKLKVLIIPTTVTITDEQKNTLTNRGCTVTIK